MAKLDHELRQIAYRNRDGSHATQANRLDMLVMFVSQLKDCGYKVRQLGAGDLKARHINALLRVWRADGVSDGTIKNRMAAVRWWAEKIGKAEIVKENSVYGIGNREYVTNTDKSISFDQVDFSKFSKNVTVSLLLQHTFGLRREESMKFQPDYALQGQKIDLARFIKIKGSWAKGGREREIPITNESQRKALLAAVRFAGHGSLIPADKTYKTHLATFEAQTHAQGIGRTHGLRHGYAQNRYLELMGVECPARGGKNLPDELKEKDKSVRLQISQELGHNRINITSVYLGSRAKA